MECALKVQCWSDQCLYMVRNLFYGWNMAYWKVTVSRHRILPLLGSWVYGVRGKQNFLVSEFLDPPQIRWKFLFQAKKVFPFIGLTIIKNTGLITWFQHKNRGWKMFVKNVLKCESLVWFGESNFDTFIRISGDPMHIFKPCVETLSWGNYETFIIFVVVKKISRTKNSFSPQSIYPRARIL